MFYLVKTPWWLKRIYPGRIWDMGGKSKSIYLSFDDGPDPEVTPFVLDELARYGAKATFFCIGKNLKQHPELYRRILAEGHAVGNHSFDHLNGWKTNDDVYVENVLKAKEDIDSVLFRPPYGRMSRKQQKQLSEHGFKTVMWSILSGDFDAGISPEQCGNNVVRNAESGSIIVFHDSRKASEKMSYALSLVLKYFSERGYYFEKIKL